MGNMNCPCGVGLNPPVVRSLTICASCLRSVVCDETPRYATAAETMLLSDAELKAMRLARASARKAQG